MISRSTNEEYIQVSDAVQTHSLTIVKIKEKLKGFAHMTF